MRAAPDPYLATPMVSSTASISLRFQCEGLAEWGEPQGGMFFWIKLISVEDTTKLINKEAFEKEVIMLPGNVFEVDSSVKASSYIRASYSVVSEEDMNTVSSVRWLFDNLIFKTTHLVALLPDN